MSKKEEQIRETPSGVKLVSIILYIYGIIYFIFGLYWIITFIDSITKGIILSITIFIIMGIVCVSTAIGLWRLNHLAKVSAILLSLWTIIFLWAYVLFVAKLLMQIIGLIFITITSRMLIYLIYNPKARIKFIEDFNRIT